MFDSIYHMTLNYLISHFWCENIKILLSFKQCYNGHRERSGSVVECLA